MVEKVKRSKKKIESQLLSRYELVQRLVSMLAHRYNNILAGILAECEAIMDEEAELKKSQEERFSRIIMQAERGSRLGKTLLGLGGIIGEEIDVDINKTIQEVEDLIQIAFGSKTPVSFALSDEIPYAFLREGIVEDLLLWIVGFYSLFSEKSKVLIETHLQNLESGEKMSVLSIRLSEGVDSPQEFLNLIENPPTTNRFISHFNVLKENIESYGGKIEVTAEKKSIVFTAKFKGKTAFSSLINYQGEKLPEGMGTILFVEDESALRDIIRMTLERLGYTVYPAENCQNAKEVFNKLDCQIDLLLTDIILPDGNGLKLGRELRKEGTFPIILISGYTDLLLPSKEEMERENITFLSKPFKRATLAKIIKDKLLS